MHGCQMQPAVLKQPAFHRSSIVVTHEMTGAHKPSVPRPPCTVRLNATARETLLVGDSLRRDIALHAFWAVYRVAVRDRNPTRNLTVARTM